MLVLALFVIVLASALAALIMAGSSQLVRTTRHEHESILTRQLLDSGKAWVRAHPGVLPDTQITLSGGPILPDGVSGEVRITNGTAPSTPILITATISFPGREVRKRISVTAGS
jgi:hypothetical protein